MQNKGDVIKHISDLPVSRNTIKDREKTMTSKEHQLKGLIINIFLISFNETTDVSSLAKFSNAQTMREELIKLGTVLINVSGNKISNVVKTLHDLSFVMSQAVSVMTDGAPNTVGKKGWIRETVYGRFWTARCVISLHYPPGVVCQGRSHRTT